jgi:probable rRNA maturation factor
MGSLALARGCDSIEASMMTLEPPRTLSGTAGKTGQVPDAEAWRAWGLSRSGLSRFLNVAQAEVGLEGEVDVLLAGDRTLRRLNRSYRGKDQATDVLSFPAAEELAGMHGGDLAISLDTAKRQADEHGHTLRDEVRVLLLHGLLHLSGMDHEVDGGEMAEREGELRGKLRLPNGLIARVAGRAKANARSRFPEGMTERKARTEAKATARATTSDATGANLKRKRRVVKRRSGVRA